MITRTTTVTMKTISILMTIALIINENKDDNGGNNRDNEDGNDDCNDENVSPKHTTIIERLRSGAITDTNTRSRLRACVVSL